MDAERALARPEPRARRGATASATRTRSSRSRRASTGAGDGRARASAPSRRAILRVVAHPAADAVPELEDGREAARLAAVCARLSGDDRFLARRRRSSRGYVAALARQRRSRAALLAPRALLLRHPGRGPRAARPGGRLAGPRARSPRAWRAPGGRGSPRAPSASPARLGAGLRRAVRRSERRLPDGSLFLPMRLDDGERPYDTRHRVARRAATGTSSRRTRSPPASSRRAAPQARGALAYLLAHGSRLLGLVRAGGYALYGRGARSAGLGHRPGLRRQRVALPGRRGRAGPARPQPLRPARRRDDAEHVRRRRGRERRAARRPALPRDVPAAERVAERRVPRDAAADARPGDAGRAPARRSRRRARWLGAGKRIAVAGAADALRPGLVLAGGRARTRSRPRRGAARAAADAARCGCASRPARSSRHAAAAVRRCDRHDRLSGHDGSSISSCGPRRVRRREAGVDVRLRGLR